MYDLTIVKEFRLKLYPEDFAEVRAFYEHELGYPIIHQWDRPGSQGVMFSVGSTVLELLTPRPHYQPIVGADVSWKVADVWKLYEAMKDKPYVLRGLKDNSWGDTSFHIQDPEGFHITFFSQTR
jgi:hypothetical protein